MQLRGLLGVIVLLMLAVALSRDRRRIPWKLVGIGLLMQFLLAALMVPERRGMSPLLAAAALVDRLVNTSQVGARFVLGELVSTDKPWGFIFAVQVIPAIVFFSALAGVLYHFGVMQRVIALAALAFRKTLGISGTESMVVAANIFVGPTEALLCVRPYVPRMTNSQLMLVMTSGYATISGAMLAVYALLLGGQSEPARLEFARHLIAASVMSAPAAVLLAKIIVPETDEPPSESLPPATFLKAQNAFDAAANGACEGLSLSAAIAATLIAFVALIALMNWPLDSLSHWQPVEAWRDSFGLPPFSLQQILGWLTAPLAWTLGVPSQDCLSFGRLLGEEVILTELVAYQSLADMVHANPPAISHRSAQMATYALCGFTNFACLAVQLSGLAALAPERRADIASLALRALAAGALATYLTAAVAGLFIPVT